MYEFGKGVRKDMARAKSLYQLACDGKDAMGCAGLAFMYENGHAVPKDKRRAKQLYKEACAGGFEMACKSAR
jgi:hypothetical protein